MYRDGEKFAEYEYTPTYWMAGSIVALPLLWINAITDSEYDAFLEATKRFFAEASADGVFDGSRPPPHQPAVSARRTSESTPE